MAQFPISLERYFFTRFTVVSNPDHVGNDEETINVDLDSSINVKQPDEGGGEVFIAEQRVRLDASSRPELPYSLDVECIGFFRVNDELPSDERQKAVTLVAHNVLYSAVRESVLSATSRQAWGPFSIGLSVLRTTTSVDAKKTSELPKKIARKGKSLPTRRTKKTP